MILIVNPMNLLIYRLRSVSRKVAVRCVLFVSGMNVMEIAVPENPRTCRITFNCIWDLLFVGWTHYPLFSTIHQLPTVHQLLANQPTNQPTICLLHLLFLPPYSYKSSPYVCVMHKRDHPSSFSMARMFLSRRGKPCILIG